MKKRFLSILLLLSIAGIIGQIVRTGLKTYQSGKRVVELRSEVEDIRAQNSQLDAKF